MTNKARFEACVAAAPNFRIGIEYPVLGRSLVWRGTPRGTLTELSAGLLLPESEPFEPKLAALLQQAQVTLQKAAV